MAVRTDRRVIGVGVVVAASCVAGIVLTRAATGRADPSDTSTAERDEPRVSDVAFHYALFEQRGRGYQSQADPVDGRGSERAIIFQPNAAIRIHQSSEIEHEVVVPIDVVSAASPDALDATTSASRVNEAGGVDVTTRYRPAHEDTFAAHYGFHVEEPLRSGFAGIGYARSLADDNFTIAASLDGIFDSFAPHDHFGHYDHHVQRYTASGNLTVSQLLSPSTIVGASYGLTYQRGVLATTWNWVQTSTPGNSLDELLPSDRWRHAVSGYVAQAIAATRTTLRLSYRYYTDTFALQAHTAELRVFQFLGRQWLVRFSYRFHRQSSVSFFTTVLPDGFPMTSPRTSDSDLAAFTAHEGGVLLRYYLDPAGALTSRSSYVDASYFRYQRTNGLSIDLFTIGFGMLL